MAIYLDGEALPGFDHRVRATGQLVREDQSGTGSTTGATFKGWKAWVLSLSCKVRFSDAADVVRLRALFQARDGAEAPKLYALADVTAAALGVTHARFADYFQVDPDERLRVWHVKLTMIEERSIAERTDERVAPAAAAKIGAPPETATTLGFVPLGVEDSFTEKMLAAGEKFASLFFPKPPEN